MRRQKLAISGLIDSCLNAGESKGWGFRVRLGIGLEVEGNFRVSEVDDSHAY